MEEKKNKTFSLNSHDRISLLSVPFVIFGIIDVSIFSNIRMLVMHDVIDSAKPSHPINKPVVYKSKQKNFRIMATDYYLYFSIVLNDVSAL